MSDQPLFTVEAMAQPMRAERAGALSPAKLSEIDEALRAAGQGTPV